MEMDSSDRMTFLKQENIKFFQIFDFFPDAVLLMRKSDKVVMDINGACEKLIGYKREEIIGQTALKMVFFLNPDLWTQVFEQLETEKSIRNIDTRIMSKENTVVNVNISINHIDLGDNPHYLTILRHIKKQESMKTDEAEPPPQINTSIEYLLAQERGISRKDIRQLIDFPAIQEMMNAFYRTTHIGIAITDLEGNVQVATGWQDICTKFHRIHPETLGHCKKSDIYLSQNVKEGQYSLYKCKNNMWDIATPIVVGGRHIANLFLGQFFFDDEVLDYELFTKQAKKYGFDEKEYLAALADVPRWSRETVYNVMDFYTKLAVMVSRLSIANVQLGKSLKKQKQIEAKLKKHRDHLADLVKETQKRLIQSEKMAGIGQLAAGVAHEINNPTGFVMSNLQILSVNINQLFSIIDNFEELLRNNSPQDPEKSEALQDCLQKLKENYDIDYLKEDLPELINECLEGTNRIKNIVANLKSFTHPGMECHVPVNLNNEIEKALNLVLNEVKYNCEIVKEYGELPKISGNPQQIEQVMMNILINASHAIEDKGTIRIKTYHQGEHVTIEVTDSGKGMHEDIMDKIFDPFFTTKDVGKGTGLGLYIVYGIIEEHKGKIDVESKIGEGTKIIIKFPVEIARHR
ncbi:PocR ligand-binding domain-containing protein [Desulfobacter vibrioformis]|uniref:PocR ligand-binding domain-containing protein n=1 Tax=Desulfobacter vibrioformis TaxID=34031 RepID=UPI00068B256B|nr:PocR ligand-binding domain-containing protein [Desulfobacter vibrioformis]